MEPTRLEILNHFKSNGATNVIINLDKRTNFIGQVTVNEDAFRKTLDKFTSVMIVTALVCNPKKGSPYTARITEIFESDFDDIRTDNKEFVFVRKRYDGEDRIGICKFDKCEIEFFDGQK